MGEVELEIFDQRSLGIFFLEKTLTSLPAARLKSFRLRFGLRNPSEPIQNILFSFINSFAIC